RQPVLPGGTASLFPKQVRKVMFIGKMKAIGNLFHGERGVAQKKTGGFQLSAKQIIVRRLSVFFFKDSGQLGGGKTGLLCQPGDTQRFIQVLVNVLFDQTGGAYGRLGGKGKMIPYFRENLVKKDSTL